MNSKLYEYLLFLQFRYCELCVKNQRVWGEGYKSGVAEGLILLFFFFGVL